MKWFVSFLFIGAICVLLSPEKKALSFEGDQNEFPMILVHGLGGWGKEEVKGFNYWGGLRDIEADLNQNGFETHVASIGPVSSNWDRAAELYAYLRGGTVDYGAAHAQEHQHDRFGKTYPGVLDEWDDTNKVHLIGHSMGGQTSRMLGELLKSGSVEEQEFHEANPEGEEMSPLYAGGKDWIHSITTIGTPHNGSAVTDEAGEFVPFLKKFVWKYISLADYYTNDYFNYNFDLDHWGLKRRSGESLSAYVDRLFANSFWETADTSQYDLTTVGAKELNDFMKTYDDVYYFSYTGDATYDSIFTSYRIPLLSMNPILHPAGYLLGRYDNSEFGIDSTWYANDGLVSVPSSQYPSGHPAKKVNVDNPEIGVWNYHDTLYRWDHIDFVGIDLADTLGLSDIHAFYKEIATNLAALPSN
ncbi:lipase [Bacillus spongiae]|uniref:triacylglycerol lipase n=2 Tax=Bacillus spongiae TaxID=2683610 RepID=A0ABU8HC48_9BACI